MEQSVENVSSVVTDEHHLIVAFASLEGDMVDQHFGSAQGFYVYDIHPNSANLLAEKHFAKEKKDGNEDKLKPKMSWLVGCDVVYCGSIGGSATRQLVSLGITPVKVTGGPDVDELIEEIQAQLNGEAEFWLTNILRQKNKAKSETDRFAFSSDDAWDD